MKVTKGYEVALYDLKMNPVKSMEDLQVYDKQKFLVAVKPRQFNSSKPMIVTDRLKMFATPNSSGFNLKIRQSSVRDKTPNPFLGDKPSKLMVNTVRNKYKTNEKVFRAFVESSNNKAKQGHRRWNSVDVPSSNIKKERKIEQIKKEKSRATSRQTQKDDLPTYQSKKSVSKLVNCLEGFREAKELYESLKIEISKEVVEKSKFQEFVIKHILTLKMTKFDIGSVFSCAIEFMFAQFISQHINGLIDISILEKLMFERFNGSLMEGEKYMRIVLIVLEGFKQNIKAFYSFLTEVLEDTDKGKNMELDWVFFKYIVFPSNINKRKFSWVMLFLSVHKIERNLKVKHFVNFRMTTDAVNTNLVDKLTFMKKVISLAQNYMETDELIDFKIALGLDQYYSHLIETKSLSEISMSGVEKIRVINLLFRNFINFY